MAKKTVGKRTTAQRRAAAKASWARRRAEAEAAKNSWPTPASFKAASDFMKSNVPPKLELSEFSPGKAETVFLAPPVTVSVTHEGIDYYLGINNNGSLHRVKVTPETLRAMALDALRLVG